MEAKKEAAEKIILDEASSKNDENVTEISDISESEKNIFKQENDDVNINVNNYVRENDDINVYTNTSKFVIKRPEK